MKAFREESAFYQLRLKHLFKHILEIKPRHEEKYLHAMVHKSYAQISDIDTDNERLEFLGDAMYNAFCSEFVFHKYENNAEGKLTQLKSKLASRSFLNGLGKELGLNGLIKHNLDQDSFRGSNLTGNALEALFGAVYLDLGNKKFRLMLNNLFQKYVDIEHVKIAEKDYKSLFWQYCQQLKEPIEVVAEEVILRDKKQFRITLIVESLGAVDATAKNKKLAQQRASKLFLQKLGKL
jgi:ribonuclease-3